MQYFHFSGWLIVACHDGLLKLYSCEEHNNETLTVKFEYEVWKYADLMAILNMKLKEIDEDKSIMVFSKENVVLVFLLGKEKILNENFYEFEKKVAGTFDQYFSYDILRFFFMHFILSGLEILDDSRLLVILCNNKAYEVYIDKPESTSKECSPIKFNSTTSLDQYSCYGVSFSKNKLWGLFYMKYVIYLIFIRNNLKSAKFIQFFSQIYFKLRPSNSQRSSLRFNMCY